MRMEEDTPSYASPSVKKVAIRRGTEWSAASARGEPYGSEGARDW